MNETIEAEMRGSSCASAPCSVTFLKCDHIGWAMNAILMTPGVAIACSISVAWQPAQFLTGCALGVCFVPARVDANWWHNYAAKGDVTFIRGRLKFGDGKNSAPFPSALVVLKAHNAGAQRPAVNNSGA